MKVKLNEIIDALDFANDEMFSSDIGNYKNMSEDEVEDLIEELIMLPIRYDINEYKMMEDFTNNIEDIRLQNGLYISLNGRGKFRRFKDICINYDIINDWYKFREEKYKEIAINWCKNNNIKFE